MPHTAGGREAGSERVPRHPPATGLPRAWTPHPGACVDLPAAADGHVQDRGLWEDHLGIVSYL